MLAMSEGIRFEAKMGDGSQPEQGMVGKLLGAGKRAITGESLFLTHFTNHGGGKAKVSFAAPYPGKIVPVNLAEVGNRLIAQKDAFLCAAMGTRIGIAFNRRLGATSSRWCSEAKGCSWPRYVERAASGSSRYR
jgi:uncharacterized protein (AIM24 family)